MTVREFLKVFEMCKANIVEIQIIYDGQVIDTECIECKDDIRHVSKMTMESDIEYVRVYDNDLIIGIKA